MLMADKVYVNGKIYCIVPRGRVVEAVAIKDGRFIGVGTTKEISSYISLSTKVINLEGKAVLPGLHEMHIHAIMGANKELNECKLPFNSQVEVKDLLQSVKAFAEENPHKSWIVGGKWLAGVQSQLNKESLDEIDSKRPIILFDFSLHNAWVNSKALEIAGIDANTPDPEGGQIEKDENGEPTGLLFEHASKLVSSHAPEMTAQQYIEAAEWAVQYMNAFGITAMKECMADKDELDAYQYLSQKNKLSLRLAPFLLWKVESHVPFEHQFDLIKNREKYADQRINPNFAKIFLDGVPAFKTGAFLEPYEGDDPETHSPDDYMLIDSEQLNKDLIYLDEQGLTVKMHATSDAAVRKGLDAIEAARIANGFSGLKHEIAHCGYIHPDDLKRFITLDATAEFSPPLWYPSVQHDETKVPILGRERADNTSQVRSMLETGALVIGGSDWPVAHDANPWPAIEALVTRKNPYENYPGTLKEEESIELIDAIEMFTINGAHSMYLSQSTGSIQIGKLADIIVLDRDIFTIPKEEIRHTQVLETVVEGEVVYVKKTKQSVMH